MKERGMVLSSDLLLALIPLTIIFGMATVAMDNLFYLSQLTVFHASIDRAATNVADALVETPGKPPDWYLTGQGIPGLAIVRNNVVEKNHLSSFKLFALRKEQVQNMLGPQYDFYLRVVDHNNTVIRNLSSNDLGSPPSNVPNIYRVEREVRVNRYPIEVVVSLVNFRFQNLIVGELVSVIRKRLGTWAPYTIDFTISDAELNNYDYWILIKNNGYTNVTVKINDNTVVNETNLNDMPVQINSTYLKSGSNSVTITTSNATKNATMDFYIVKVPKDTVKDMIKLEYIEEVNARLELFVWPKH